MWAYFAHCEKAAEGVRPDQRHQQPLAEDVVEPRDRQHDEAGCRHPVREALEGVEAQDLAARFLVGLERDPAAREIERRERQQHAEHRDAADPGQRTLAEAAVVAALRLLEQRGLAVRNGDAALELVQLAQELVLLDRHRGRVRAARRCWAEAVPEADDDHQAQCREHGPEHLDTEHRDFPPLFCRYAFERGRLRRPRSSHQSATVSR